MRAAAPRLLLGALLAWELAACSDSSGPNRPAVSLSFASQASPAIVTEASTGYNVTVTSGNNTLVITKAQVVLRELELKLSASTACADGEADDDCEEIKLAPMLVDLPVTTGVVTALTASIPAGTYSEIEFDIHKPGDDALDAAFKAANPAFANISVRVEGTYNGQPFVFTSTANESVELEFTPAVVIDESNNNVTVLVDLRSWFRASDGALIDPATANPGQPNASLVASNIKASLDAIEDDDEDGR